MGEPCRNASAKTLIYGGTLLKNLFLVICVMIKMKESRQVAAKNEVTQSVCKGIVFERFARDHFKCR